MRSPMISESPPPPRRRFFHALALAAGLGLLAAAARAEISKAYEIKAAYLYNFAKFVEWPADRFASPDSPIVIGVVGKNPFGDELAATVQGRKVNGRDAVVVAVASKEQLGSVHVLFVPAGEESQVDLSGAKGLLIVGESERCAEQGGMITFVPAADKIRFTINLVNAEQAGLKISVQLLKLASSVHRKSPD